MNIHSVNVYISYMLFKERIRDTPNPRASLPVFFITMFTIVTRKGLWKPHSHLTEHAALLLNHTEHFRAKHKFNTKDCNILIEVFIPRDFRAGTRLISHVVHRFNSGLTLAYAGYSSPSPAPPSPNKPRERASLNSLSFTSTIPFQTLSIQLRRNCGWTGEIRWVLWQ